MTAMLDHCQRDTPKLIDIAQLTLLTIWNDLPQEFIDIKAIVSFRNRHRSYVAAAGGHSKHSKCCYWAAEIYH